MITLTRADTPCPTSRLQDQWSPELEVFTDASGEVGCGALWGTQWLQLKWANTVTWKDTPITQKEVLPVVLACAVWGHQWRSKRVLLHCDNEAAVAVLYSDDSLIMHLLRALFFIKAHFALDVRVTHMLNKNTLDVKKVRGQSEAALQIGMCDQKL